MERHHLDPAAFGALASGGGGTLVAALRTSRLSRHLLLVKFIADAWPGEPADRDAPLEVLARAQERDPECVADLVGDPMVGAWTAWTARRIRCREFSATPLHADLAHLGAVAAVAATRTGLDADLAVCPRHGRVPFPTLGEALVPLPAGRRTRAVARGGSLTVRVGGATLTVPDDPATDTASWHGLRRLDGGAGQTRLSVTLQDLDPYRGGHHVPPAARLSRAEVERWQRVFGPAWDLLAKELPARALELASGLRALVPLARARPGSAHSATTPDSFGAFGLTLPRSDVDFVVTLVHEFQHSKLSAVLDLVTLCDTSGDGTYYAPWRADPRPIGGLLQGAYAFLGVADTWRSLSGRADLRDRAVQEFADVREQVHHAVAVLEGSAELTPDGRRFVAGMRRTVDGMMAEPLSTAAVGRAREALRRNRQAWQRRHDAGTRDFPLPH
jgi:HEXXH motif-containing protein